MTTTLRNTPFDQEARAFLARILPVNPLPFLYALGDSVKQQGTNWIRTDQAKAILYTLIQMAYGQDFHLDGIAEFDRLRSIMEEN